MFFSNKKSKMIDEVLFTRPFNERNQPLFDKVDANVKNLDINFQVGKGYQVRFHGKEEDQPEVKIKNRILKIRQPEHFKTHHLIDVKISGSNYGLIITTPKDMPVDQIKINSASGDLFFDQTIAQDLSLKLASGDLHFDQVNCENAMIELSSGDARLRNFEATNLKMDAASGDIELSNSTIVSLANLSTASGDLAVSNTKFRSYELQSSSGECCLFSNVASAALLKQGNGQEPILKMNTASGDCVVK